LVFLNEKIIEEKAIAFVVRFFQSVGL